MRKVRLTVIIGGALLALVVAIGFVWSWALALAFLFGGSLCVLCFVITYYTRTATLLNNLPDTRQSSFAALISNQKARREAALYTSEQETFVPFSFRDKTSLTEEEEERVRALLRQVFPEEQSNEA